MYWLGRYLLSTLNLFVPLIGLIVQQFVVELEASLRKIGKGIILFLFC